ncbi:uncharacterized protein N7515_003102 [Penicillium bovifimosum]|uniref:Uncharacterized protein n=1 Tax=Penicillium bovifimosum TaxID=126998 RepID=A0A9W9L5E6_9EURO|nr:uncharacterized protein N7515_003102 [Penicillium bovifimosum]KAJ5138254.1 hypothetical protein N7515_003102 [Penicillium bovifimosum]
MRLLWALCLGNALASTIPSKLHQLRLPFVPSPDNLENGVRSSLSINWSIKNGALYANQDKIYPPSLTMQLRAPLLEGVDQTNPSDKTVEVSYTLDSRPLFTDRVGSVAGMVRVRVELFDLHGNLISPNAVAVDLLAYQNGDFHITRVRIEPARGGDEEDRFTQNSRPWVVKYWRTQFGSIFEKTQTAVSTDDSRQIAESSAENDTPKATGSQFTTVSETKSPFSISAFGAAPAAAYPHHRSGHHGPHHGHRPKHSFMAIFSPAVLPAVLGATAGLVACLVGFFIGHLLMSLAVRLGWQKEPNCKSQNMSVEEGTPSEKSPMVSLIYATDESESNV